MGLRYTRIEPVIDFWKSRNPAFLWAPTSLDTLLLDRARGLKGTPVGLGATIRPGGIVQVPGGTSSYITFPTNVGIGGGISPFIGVMLVSVVDPSSLTGEFLKIGGVVNGLGYGAGATTFDDTGGNIVLLQEAVAWTVGPASAFVSGLNVLAFGVTNQSVNVFTSLTNGSDVSNTAASSNIAPDPFLSINGAAGGRNSNAKVHAIAIYQKSLTNAEFVAERALLAAPALKLGIIQRSSVDSMFVARRSFDGLSPAGGAIFMARPGLSIRQSVHRASVW